MTPPPARIIVTRLGDLPDRDRAVEAIDAIFFETSGTRQFDSEAERAAHRERWLGRYLKQWPDEAFVALAEGAVIGYVVGCLSDPARHPSFADLPYLSELAHLTARFPAHLHVNLTAAWQGKGIGRELVEAFAAHAAAAGAPGVHVVTGAGARNNRFYLACGFRQLGAALWNGNRLAFFGRPLSS